jgi:hypothetical protein
LRNRFCLKCGYNLAGTPSVECPECGRPYSIADPTSYTEDYEHLRRNRCLKRLVIVGGTFAVCVMCCLLIVVTARWQVDRSYRVTSRLLTNPEVTRTAVDSKVPWLWAREVGFDQIPWVWRPSDIDATSVTVVKYTTTIPIASMHAVFRKEDGRLILVIPTYE